MMKPHYDDESVVLYHGDCLDVLRELPDASVDAVVTDPPYGLGFMGKDWDRIEQDESRPPSADETDARFAYKYPRTGKGPAAVAFDGHAFQAWCEQWATECLRVLKPGGHMLAFGGTRTWHRLACAIEDAGFEVRDSIAWMTGSGFPKSLNATKAMKESGRACTCEPTPEHDLRPMRDTDVPAPVPTGAGAGSLLLESVPQQGPPGHGAEAQLGALRVGESGMEGRRDAQAAEGELHGRSLRQESSGVPTDGAQGRLHHGASARDGSVGGSAVEPNGSGESQGSQPIEQSPVESGALADERGSQAWRGWPLCERCGKPSIPDGLGTALKPAHEPIVVARKPLNGTVAANVLAHGTGALNVDGCRIGYQSNDDLALTQTKNPGRSGETFTSDTYGADRPQQSVNTSGRWPANVVLDPAAAAELDRQSGTSATRPAKAALDGTGSGSGIPASGVPFVGGVASVGYEDTGGASRFFKVAESGTIELWQRLVAQARLKSEAYEAGHDYEGSAEDAEQVARALGPSQIRAIHLDEMAARFQYVAKAGSSERPRIGGGSQSNLKNPRCRTCGRLRLDGRVPCVCPEPDLDYSGAEQGIAHPTVKPLDLMRWLVRLVTPPGGIVLEPFAGSGTTAEACIVEGFRCIAIEREADYLPLILQRITKPIEPVMF